MDANIDLVNYGCGVLSTTSSRESLGPHAVVIVDYGTTDTGADFWVIKNSWGSHGESRYFRVRRGEGDFQIERNIMSIPLLSLDPALPPPDSTAEAEAEAQQTCATEEVTEPLNNVFTMSAVEFALYKVLLTISESSAPMKKQLLV